MRYVISGYNEVGVTSHQRDEPVDAIKKAVEMRDAGFRDVFIRDTQAGKSYRGGDFARLMGAIGLKVRSIQPSR
jgi:hypothetical protein